MSERTRAWGLLLGLLGGGLGGCAPRALRLENELLRAENTRLHATLAAQAPAARGTADAGPASDAAAPTVAELRQWMEGLGLAPPDEPVEGLLAARVEGEHARFRLTARVYERQRIVLLMVTDYLRVDDAPHPGAVVALLTELAVQNYELLMGKLQLNPATGEISLSVELSYAEGLGFETFRDHALRLVQTADHVHPTLQKAAQADAL